MRQANPLPHISNLQANLRYCEETGNLYWRTSRNGSKRRIGSVAGSQMKQGYLRVCFDRTWYLAHRIAWVMHTGSEIPGGMEVDHINGCKNDNRPSNLRLATHQQNNFNAGAFANSQTGVRGVHYNKKRNTFVAVGHFNGKKVLHREFKSFEQAVQARHDFAAAHYGNFAYVPRDHGLQHLREGGGQ